LPLVSSNVHQGLEKIIKRAGLVPWDDLLQTLRRSAETDFAKRYPQHAVSRWIGHSMAVSEWHYLQVDGEILDAATRSDSRIAPSQERPQSETTTNSDASKRRS